MAQSPSNRTQKKNCKRDREILVSVCTRVCHVWESGHIFDDREPQGLLQSNQRSLENSESMSRVNMSCPRDLTKDQTSMPCEVRVTSLFLDRQHWIARFPRVLVNHSCVCVCSTAWACRRSSRRDHELVHSLHCCDAEEERVAHLHTLRSCDRYRTTNYS